MSKQIQLPSDRAPDLSRFFNSPVFNRSIKLWVNQTCFTCSKLILAQHSSIFEQHLKDSPPSVLLEDFHNIPDAENAIQDGLILLYGGTAVVSTKNIKILTKFATIYDIRKLMIVCMEFIEDNLTVETVMEFFKILKSADDDGYPVVPDLIRKFMENHTGPIVDYILKSADDIDDEFLLALLELPSSSILVQRCLKAGILPDPIVDLIFKHSDTINVNFLLHDDKRTYVRLINILKSKARSYHDMEKIIEIQQKCISKMCDPYGSVDSLALHSLTPAPSINHMQQRKHPGNMVDARQKHPEGMPDERRKESHRVPYQPRSLESRALASTEEYEDEYMLPEELKTVQEKRSSLERENRPPLRSYDREVEHIPQKSFTTQHHDMPPRTSSVSDKARNLEKTFIAKFPDSDTKPAFFRPKPSNENMFSENDTAAENSDITDFTSTKMKSLRINKRGGSFDRKQDNHDRSNKTNYAQVYTKKFQEQEQEGEKQLEYYKSQTRELMDHQANIAEALNKLAAQQAIIEHTYDNMSAASSARQSNSLRAPSRSTNESSSARVSRNPSTHASRRRTNSSHGPRFKKAQSGEREEPSQPNVPTTFYAANAKPPPLPSNPPPPANTESFFTKGGKEVGPPLKSIETRSQPIADEKSLEVLESNLDDGFLPPGCLPDHDRLTSPPSTIAADGMMSPRGLQSPSGPLSPDLRYREREFARNDDRNAPWDHNGRQIDPKSAGGDPNVFAHSSILINKHWHKQRERSKSRERKDRKSMKKKKDIQPPLCSTVGKPLEHVTKGRPRKASSRPPTRTRVNGNETTTSNPIQAWNQRNENMQSNGTRARRSDEDDTGKRNSDGGGTARRSGDRPSSVRRSGDLNVRGNDGDVGHAIVGMGDGRRKHRYHIKHIPSNIPGNHLQSTV